MTQELIKSVCIDTFVSQRDAILKRVEEARKLLEEAIAIGDSLNVYDIKGKIQHYRSSLFDIIDNFDLVKKRIDSTCWRYLMDESGMKTFLDSKAREEWWKAIDEYEVIELTTDNIRSTFKNLYDSREEMFERGIEQLFKGLSWDYKSNLPVKFGKKIVTCVSYGGFKHSGLASAACDKVDDLLRCSYILDGKPENDHRRAFYFAVSTAFHNNQNWYEDDYIDVKFYKNGNAHIVLKRLDLVEKMNKIIAKRHPNALPAGRD